MGGELKATFCLIKDGAADPFAAPGRSRERRNLRRLPQESRRSTPSSFITRRDALVADRHPEYLSTKLANGWARIQRLPLIEAQHHHAHVAACLAENLRPLDAPRVLGVVLDGLGLGGDGTIWGGEFLLADYRGFERLGTFKPVAMLGGAQAAREPWRNLYAHLTAEMSWAELRDEFRLARIADRSRAAAARDAAGDARGRRQFAAGVVRAAGCSTPSPRRLAFAASARLTKAKPARGWRRSSTARRCWARMRTAAIPSPSQGSPVRDCPISSRWRCGAPCSAISS